MTSAERGGIPQTVKDCPQPQVVCRIRIPNDELRALQVFLVVDLGTHQVLHAHRIDQQRNALRSRPGCRRPRPSSKVKPYWNPEQPPPEMNTRSMRFGLSSSADELADLVRPPRR